MTSNDPDTRLSASDPAAIRDFVDGALREMEEQGELLSGNSAPWNVYVNMSRLERLYDGYPSLFRFRQEEELNQRVISKDVNDPALRAGLLMRATASNHTGYSDTHEGCCEIPVWTRYKHISVDGDSVNIDAVIVPRGSMKSESPLQLKYGRQDLMELVESLGKPIPLDWDAGKFPKETLMRCSDTIEVYDSMGQPRPWEPHYFGVKRGKQMLLRVALDETDLGPSGEGLLDVALHAQSAGLSLNYERVRQKEEMEALSGKRTYRLFHHDDLVNRAVKVAKLEQRSELLQGLDRDIMLGLFSAKQHDTPMADPVTLWETVKLLAKPVKDIVMNGPHPVSRLYE